MSKESLHQSFLHAIFRTFLMNQLNESDLVLYDTSAKGSQLLQPDARPDFTILRRIGNKGYQKPRWRDVCGIIELKKDIEKNWKVSYYFLLQRALY